MKTFLSTTFKLLVSLLSLYGFYMTLFSGGAWLENFSYFTTQTVFWTWITYTIYTIRLIFNKPLGKLARYFKQLWMVMLILTAFVYSFVLIPYLMMNQIDYPIASIKDIVIHFGVPTVVIVDYILFDKKGQIEKKSMMKNIIFPMVYLAYILIFVLLGGRFTLGGYEHLFPYFFLNYQALGILPVVGLCFAITAFILYVSWLVYTLDYILGQKLDQRYQ